MKRLLTAAALIPVIVYVVLFANYWVFLAVLTAAALLSYREYDGIAAAYGFGSPGPLGYGFGLALLVPPWKGDAWRCWSLPRWLALALAMRGGNSARRCRAPLFCCWDRLYLWLLEVRPAAARGQPALADVRPAGELDGRRGRLLRRAGRLAAIRWPRG